MEDEHDRLLRLAAFDRARELSRRYTDLVPLDVLKEGFAFDGRRISFGSFYSGIFRPKELHGPSALALVTAPAKAESLLRTRTRMTRARDTSRTASVILAANRRKRHFWLRPTTRS